MKLNQLDHVALHVADVEQSCEFYERVRPAGAWARVAIDSGLPHQPLGLRPWLDVAAATVGIYAAIAGVGWLLFGEFVQGLMACATAIALLYLAIRGAVADQRD